MFGFIVILFMTPSGHSWIINKMIPTKNVVRVPGRISVVGSMEFDRKETSFDLEFLAVNLQF